MCSRSNERKARHWTPIWCKRIQEALLQSGDSGTEMTCTLRLEAILQSNSIMGQIKICSYLSPAQLAFTSYRQLWLVPNMSRISNLLSIVSLCTISVASFLDRQHWCPPMLPCSASSWDTLRCTKQNLAAVGKKSLQHFATVTYSRSYNA